MGHAHRSKMTVVTCELQDIPDILEVWESPMDVLGLTPSQHAQRGEGDQPLTWWGTVVYLPDICLNADETDRVTILARDRQNGNVMTHHRERPRTGRCPA